jgi:hypothetical protein
MAADRYPARRQRKGQEWELWLIAPGERTQLGAYPSLEALNRAQITLYQCWEGGPESKKPTAE